MSTTATRRAPWSRKGGRIIVRHYPIGGAEVGVSKLTGRSASAIYFRAYTLPWAKKPA